MVLVSDAMDAGTAPQERTRPRQGMLLAVIVLIVVGLDQLTKFIVRNTIERGESVPEGWPVRLVYYTNSGAAFGILQGATTLLAITSVLGIGLIVIYIMSPGFARPLMRAGFAFMLGGAIGNLIDRVLRGEVDDFIKFPNFPAFNVADSAINIGVALVIWTLLTDDSPEKSSSN